MFSARKSTFYGPTNKISHSLIQSFFINSLIRNPYMNEDKPLFILRLMHITQLSIEGFLCLLELMNHSLRTVLQYNNQRENLWGQRLVLSKELQNKDRDWDYHLKYIYWRKVNIYTLLMHENISSSVNLESVLLGYILCWQRLITILFTLGAGINRIILQASIKL